MAKTTRIPLIDLPSDAINTMHLYGALPPSVFLSPKTCQVGLMSQSRYATKTTSTQARANHVAVLWLTGMMQVDDRVCEGGQEVEVSLSRMKDDLLEELASNQVRQMKYKDFHTVLKLRVQQSTRPKSALTCTAGF